MTMLNHVDYYRQREAEARAMAERAADPAIARLHRDLAATYAARVESARELNAKVDAR